MKMLQSEIGTYRTEEIEKSRICFAIPGRCVNLHSHRFIANI